jgi:hypothetical protein
MNAMRHDTTQADFHKQQIRHLISEGLHLTRAPDRQDWILDGWVSSPPDNATWIQHFVYGRLDGIRESYQDLEQEVAHVSSALQAVAEHCRRVPLLCHAYRAQLWRCRRDWLVSILIVAALFVLGILLGCPDIPQFMMALLLHWGDTNPLAVLNAGVMALSGTLILTWSMERALYIQPSGANLFPGTWRAQVLPRLPWVALVVMLTLAITFLRTEGLNTGEASDTAAFSLSAVCLPGFSALAACLFHKAGAYFAETACTDANRHYTTYQNLKNQEDVARLLGDQQRQQRRGIRQLAILRQRAEARILADPAVRAWIASQSQKPLTQSQKPMETAGR